MMKKIIFFSLSIIVLAAAFVLLKGNKPDTEPKTAKLSRIPANAEIVYHADGLIYTMDRNGDNVEQITFDKRSWEHVAVSPDHRYIVGNEQTGNPNNPSVIWLFDLEQGTQTKLVPDFPGAGMGGVDWDKNGYIYFGGLADAKEVTSNPGAQDIYRIKYDGTNLQRLTHSKDATEWDVSVSEDGAMIAYVKSFATGTPDEETEIWIATADGKNPKRVYNRGKIRVASAHDPEFSPDNQQLTFSVVNSKVPPNFPNDPDANTAHDIWVINFDGTRLRRVTKPEPMSIIPDWQGNDIVYAHISEKEKYFGIGTVNADGKEQAPKKIKQGANSPKWIP